MRRASVIILTHALQMHISSSTAKAWNELKGIPITGFDGIAMFEAESYQDIQEVRHRPATLRA